MTTLAKELETYEKLLPSLLREQGRYAVITGDTLIGVYVSYEDALKIGYEHCGLTPFLVRKVSQEKTVLHFSRDMDVLCRA